VSAISLPALFRGFLRLGATAYGGPAMMAHFRADLVERRAWIAAGDFSEGMALCQVIPGATMIQMSTYVGFRLRGTPGAIVAALGFVLPSFLAMTLLSVLYFHSASLPVIQALFKGLGTLVTAIVLVACVKLARTTVHGWPGVLIAMLALAALLLRVNFLLVLAGAAGLAIPLYALSARRQPAPETTTR
jgi:chromate transporter